MYYLIMGYKKHLHILLTEEQHKFLLKISKINKKSIGEIVRDFVDQLKLKVHIG